MKPCPFCDSLNVATHVEPKPDGYHAWGYCKACDARGPELILNGPTWQDMHTAAAGAWEIRAEVKP